MRFLNPVIVIHPINKLFDYLSVGGLFLIHQVQKFRTNAHVFWCFCREKSQRSFLSSFHAWADLLKWSELTDVRAQVTKTFTLNSSQPSLILKFFLMWEWSRKKSGNFLTSCCTTAMQTYGSYKKFPDSLPAPCMLRSTHLILKLTEATSLCLCWLHTADKW